MPNWGRSNYAAEGSVNFFLYSNLSAVTGNFGPFTAWVTTPEESAHLRFAWGPQPLNPPCFTVAHLESWETNPDRFGQRIVSPTGGHGEHVTHLTEISCWHSRYTTASAERTAWQIELRNMEDMVRYVIDSGRRVPLLDLSVSTAPPFTTAGALRFRDLRAANDTVPDPNPAILRRRLLLTWEHLAAGPY